MIVGVDFGAPQRARDQRRKIIAIAAHSTGCLLDRFGPRRSLENDKLRDVSVCKLEFGLRGLLEVLFTRGESEAARALGLPTRGAARGSC